MSSDRPLPPKTDVWASKHPPFYLAVKAMPEHSFEVELEECLNNRPNVNSQATTVRKWCQRCSRFQVATISEGQPPLVYTRADNPWDLQPECTSMSRQRLATSLECTCPSARSSTLTRTEYWDRAGPGNGTEHFTVYLAHGGAGSQGCRGLFCKKGA